MNTFRTIVRPVVFALGIAFAIAPTAAFADEKPGQAKQEEHAKRGHHFPMKADVFKQHVEKRIAKVRVKFEKMIDKRDLPPGIEAQMKKDLEAGIAKVRAAADKVAGDGTVTKEEAQEVRDLAKSQRREMREKYAGKGKGREKNQDKPGRRERGS